jgi:predicted TIM-barrel fold metal-dependent hydrolase
LSPDSLVEQLDEGGVAKAGLFAVYAPRSVGVSTNELVISYLDEHPERFFGFASLQVDDWGSKRDSELQRLRDALAHPLMVGVKLAHAHQRFRMDDPVYYGIYEIAAEFGAPVYLHTGTSPFPGTQTAPPYCDPAYLEDAISKHPSTTFILGHLGHDATNRDIGFLDSALTLAERYPNVYLEPSALAKLGPEVEEDNMYVAFQRIEAKGLWDRVIYGSDGPQSPGFVGEHKERTATVLRALDIPVEKADAVFHGNLQRVLGSVP